MIPDHSSLDTQRQPHPSPTVPSARTMVSKSSREAPETVFAGPLSRQGLHQSHTHLPTAHASHFPRPRSLQLHRPYHATVSGHRAGRQNYVKLRAEGLLQTDCGQVLVAPGRRPLCPAISNVVKSASAAMLNSHFFDSNAYLVFLLWSE